MDVISRKLKELRVEKDKQIGASTFALQLIKDTKSSLLTMAHEQTAMLAAQKVYKLIAKIEILEEVLKEIEDDKAG